MCFQNLLTIQNPMVTITNQQISVHLFHVRTVAAQDHPHTKQKDNLDSPWDRYDTLWCEKF